LFIAENSGLPIKEYLIFRVLTCIIRHESTTAPVVKLNGKWL
jgi:hypothetical protein